MNIIAYQNNDSVAIIHPSKKLSSNALKMLVPPNSNHIILHIDDLPSERYFREAWVIQNDQLVIDIEKAKDIQRNHWRKMRKTKLETLDLAYMRALENNDSELQSKLIETKNALRDVTNTPLPDDVDGIKNTIPDILL